MAAIDWVIVASYLAFSLLIGVLFARKGSGSLTEYFVSGRTLPWWLAGTSIVATTFAADTPLAVGSIVAKQGVSGNWIWWAFLPGGLATTFFFAALWRRADVLTDAELVAIRYSGRPASILRGFRAVYLGVCMNGIIMGWVNLAMAKIVEQTIGVSRVEALGVCLAITVIYSTLSGLWGIVATDLIQFVIGMGGSIALALFALDATGGVDGLNEALAGARHPETGELFGSADAVLSFWPDPSVAWTLPVLLLGVYLAVNWWASWYPGNEPGGGGYVAQRLMAARSEGDAVRAALWFNLAHYAIRPWPWIIVGLCGVALYSQATPEGLEPGGDTWYLLVMREHLPAGFLGLLMAAFAAAYMSTMSTSLNWGASYLINDLYRPFIRPGETNRHYVAAGRVMTLAVLALSLVITAAMSTIEGAWMFLMSLGAGTGLVLILRWYWWRVNAWSEISAMVAALGASLGARFFFDADEPTGFAWTMLVTVAFTTVVWVTVTLLTPPVDDATLEHFCRRVRPPGPGWSAVFSEAPPIHFLARLGAWVTGLILIYGALFGIGAFLLGRPSEAAVYGAAAFASGLALRLLLRHPVHRSPREPAS